MPSRDHPLRYGRSQLVVMADALFFLIHIGLIQGAETTIKEWHDCNSGTAVAQWALEGARHNPAFSAQWGHDVISWLLAH